MDGLKTLIIVPAFNEAQALPATLAELHLLGESFDILVVDDGSSDATAEVARLHGALVARLPFNVGIGGALRTGFKFAVRHGYKRAIQYDADGQHEAGCVPVLIDALDRGADLVLGSRFVESGAAGYAIGSARSGAMGVLRFLIRLLAGHRLSDTSSGFRGFSWSMLNFFAREYPVEYLENVEALLVAAYEGFTIVEAPVNMRSRRAGSPSKRGAALLYHYVRVLVSLAAMASIRRRNEVRIES